MKKKKKRKKKKEKRGKEKKIWPNRNHKFIYVAKR